MSDAALQSTQLLLQAEVKLQMEKRQLQDLTSQADELRRHLAQAHSHATPLLQVLGSLHRRDSRVLSV